MTTNFALSLSFDGIQLLQRADDGWLLVGKTDLDVPDLGAALTAMREDAMLLAPDGLRTKLLIPNEQIKYVTLETAQTSLQDVQNALEGTTPYAIDDLVIDFDRNGGRTFIAAVARETLDEAEAFAKQYNFAPVSFAAIAEPLTFKTEVFFGPAKGAAGTVTRDAEPVVVIGDAVLPPPLVDDPENLPVFTPRPRMDTPESVAPTLPNAPKDDESIEADPTEPLSVPTGNADGPKVAQPDVSTPAAPSKPVVSIDATPPAAAPAVTGTAPSAEDIAATGGFASRRAAPSAPARPQEEAPKKPEKLSRKEKKAAFATKQAQEKRGKPRFLGLILTAILLIIMALVAIWASTLTEEDIAGWFGTQPSAIVETAQTPTAPTATEVVAVAPLADDASVATATPIPDETGTVLPQVRATTLGRVLSPSEADRIYAATGVWQRAPRLPLEPRSETLTLPMPQIEPRLAALALPVLPDTTTLAPDLALIAPSNPPAAGTDFERDADGFILATPEGTLTPNGALVFAGSPPKRPPLRPAAAAPADLTTGDKLPDTPEGVIVIAGRPSKVPPLRPADATLPEEPADEAAAEVVGTSTMRPNLRPEGLAPPQPAETQIAFADPALAGERPKLRPAGLAPPPAPEPATPDITDVVAAIARAAPVSPYVAPTARAVQVSRRPDTRPRNFARVVSRAIDQANKQAARQQAAAQPADAVSNAPARSSGSVPGGVANAATLQNAIKLRDVNLIGVYGQPSDRRALVRLGNGRYVKVEVGSSLDGGRVTAIGDSALNYVKRGKTYLLQLPTG